MRSLVGALIGLPVVAAIAVPIERWFAGRRQAVLRGGWRTDVCYFVTRPLLQLAGFVAGLGIALIGLIAVLPVVLLRPAVMAQPMWLLAVETFVLFDLFAYWAHRLLHEVPFLWRFHSVHHSSRDLDWLATVRDHPIDHAIVFLPALFMILAGFPLVAIVAAVTLVRGVLAIWVHMNVRWQLRPLQKIMLTPAFHRWHHASDADAINHNYAAAFPVWDVLFGTYFSPAGRRPAAFGCDSPVPDSFTGQLSYPFRARPAGAVQVTAGPL